MGRPVRSGLGVKNHISTPRESLIDDLFTCGFVALCVLGIVLAVLYNTDWWPL